jgi:hypothetical protein
MIRFKTPLHAISLQVPDGQLPAAGSGEAGDAFEASWAAYLQEATRLGLVFGTQSVDEAPVHHRQVRL